MKPCDGFWVVVEKTIKKTIKNKEPLLKLSKIIHLLGEILGLVIKEQEGITSFNKVEKLRILSKNSRENQSQKKNHKAFSKLILNITNLSPQESLVVARSFSQFLSISNIAESLYSVHKIHNYNINEAKVTNEFIILEEAISRILKNKSISKNKFYQSAQQLKIDLILTAHPTEVKRRTLIQKYEHVNNILERFNNQRIFKEKNIYREERDFRQNLHEEITSIWKTDEIKRTRPTPVEEAKWGLAVIEDSLWNAIPKVCSQLDNAVLSYTGKRLPINYSPITFGSWIGGDRDGNPNVTAKTTEEVILLSRWAAANLYEKELTQLIQSLSMHECSEALQNQADTKREPYRVFLRPIRNKMKNTQKEIELYLNSGKALNQSLLVQSINEVINPLQTVYDSLCSVKCEIIANGLVLDLLRRTYSFGLNLAKLDIRQESNQQQKLLKNICMHLGLGDYQNWSEDKKILFLSKEYQSKRPLIPQDIKLNKENKEVWSTFKMIA